MYWQGSLKRFGKAGINPGLFHIKMEDRVMKGVPTEHTLFKPSKSKSETKADVTDNAARAIIDDEVARREAKTAKLRRARLAQEADLSSEAEPAKPVKKSRVVKRGKSSA